MARREIRRVEVPDQDLTVPVSSAVEEAEAPAVHTEEPAPKAKPLDVTLTVKVPSVFVMRVWNGLILYPNKFKMERIAIAPGKPLKIRITQ